jgi:7-cyano-7-deazaguanine reductase
MPTQPATAIATFANPAPGQDYTIRMSIPEFTCLCPKTAQPDFATLELEYVPDQLCIELLSLKLYLWSFRDRGSYHEAVTNEIIDHLAGTIAPRFIRLTARFNVRGGIYTSVIAERQAPQWRAPPAVKLP